MTDHSKIKGTEEIQSKRKNKKLFKKKLWLKEALGGEEEEEEEVPTEIE